MSKGNVAVANKAEDHRSEGMKRERSWRDGDWQKLLGELDEEAKENIFCGQKEVSERRMHSRALMPLRRRTETENVFSHEGMKSGTLVRSRRENEVNIPPTPPEWQFGWI